MFRRADTPDLTDLLQNMDVPAMRRDLSSADNVAWLLRNLRARNGDHPHIDEAVAALKMLARGKRASAPKKYEHIDFTPPEGAAAAAKKGLEYREKASPSNKGGLTPAEASKEGIGSGVQRAVNLKNRDTLSSDTIKQMHGFFSRHEQNKGIAPENKGEPWNDKGHVSWLLWGGDAARSWVDKVLGQMEKADEKEKADSKKAHFYRGASPSEHAKSLALAKFLGRVAQRAGVAQHVYIVGGAVRNFLLDQPIKDIDVVVDSVALRGYDSEKFAKEIARAIPMTTNLTTNQYGVAILTVKGPWLLDGEDMDGEVIEIANARGESYGGSGGKGYKPSEVVPATIEEDVYRREFTFNTLLWRLMDVVHGPERAEVIDLTGCGRADLERKVMRCPRDPDVVFADDPTRMLRALKFAVKYGFEVPADLQASIKRNARKLAGVPHEAVGTLLVRDIFGTPRAREMLRFMDKLGLLDVIRDMVAANKGFATYLSGQLSAHDAAFLLDMDDLSMGVRLPLNFLTPAQRVRVRGLLGSLPSDEAQAFIAVLTRPALDNNALIAQFSLKPQERGLLQPLAREALLDDPTLAAHPQELTSEVARRMEQTRVRTASVNGNGSGVGFFIPLSADLALQYEAKSEDTSPPHVTFLYVGKVTPEQVPTLLRVAQGVLSTAPSVFGVLNGVDSFVQKDKDKRVLYSRVSFSYDLKLLRDRLWAALTEAGFKVEQAFPAFTPHVTIEYRDGVTDAVLDGAAPSGSWDCKTVEVWGLPKKYVLPLGGGRGRKASLDTVTYGNLTVEEEAEALSLSEVFNSDVLKQMPHRPFPANTSPETKAELAYLVRLQNTVRPYRAARVRLTDDDATETLEAYCSAHGLSTGGTLSVAQAARPVLLQLKRLYNRPRPYQLATYMEPGFHAMTSTSAHTPAYPSGHSAQTILAALLLSDMHPAHRDAFMALAQEVGVHRMVGGFHFPSDVVYGEEVGRVLYGCLARASVRTAAAKFKEKKQVPKADGSGKTTVYVYSERQIANRHREKAERLEDFKPALTKLRAQVKKDLDSDDVKKNLVALAVGLIDATYERVGNEDSAGNGHYGVTGWLRKHVTFKGKRAVIRYVGKSGVKHEKSVDDESLVGALKKCCGDKDGAEPVLSLGEHTVTSDEVNKYLKPYDITAKDLRGLHANREMQERLRAVRSKGPKLPRLRKERDTILKDEFQQALEGAAEAVGHEPATLRKQYLVPGIEEAFMKDGAVPRDLTASTRVAALYLRATKSDAEHEDEEAERLLMPEPKYKPPRGDLRRRRVEPKQESDPDKKQDDKDRSQNYKDASQRALAVRVAARFLFAEEAPDPDKALKQRAQNEFDAYKDKHPDTELDVPDFLKRLKAKANKSEKKGDDDDSEQDKEELKAVEAARKAERVTQVVKDIAAEWDGAENSVPMTEENHEKISVAIKSFTPKAREAFVAAFDRQRRRVIQEHAEYDPEAVEHALHDLNAPLQHKSPEGVAEKAVRAIFADRVLLNPLLLTPGSPLSSETGKTDEPHPLSKSVPRVKQSMERFSKASAEELTVMSERVTAALRNCRPKSPQHEELLAVQFGLEAAKTFPRSKGGGEGADEDGDGKGKGDEKGSWGKPPKGMSGVEFGLLKHLHGKGDGKGDDTSELVLLAYRSSRKDESAADDTRKFVQSQVEDMSMSELNDILPEDMQSLSAAFLSIRKSMSFSGGEKQRKERDRDIAEKEDEITERLRTTLVDCMTEVAVKKSDPKTTAKATKAADRYIADNSPPTKSKTKMDDWLEKLRASFMKMLSLKTAALAYGDAGGESPSVQGYTFLPLPYAVGGL